MKIIWLRKRINLKKNQGFPFPLSKYYRLECSFLLLTLISFSHYKQTLAHFYFRLSSQSERLGSLFIWDNAHAILLTYKLREKPSLIIRWQYTQLNLCIKFHGFFSYNSWPTFCFVIRPHFQIVFLHLFIHTYIGIVLGKWDN